jgi:hypothetical protein
VTLTLAWLRTEAGYDELVVASDSRVRGGYAWDAAPKIVPLPRSDSFIAFAGSTNIAYPMILQAVNTVSSWGPALTRQQPLDEMKGHLVRVFNRMLAEFSDEVPDLPSPVDEALFLLGGWNWTTKQFRVWTLHFDRHIGRFTFRPATPWSGGNEAKVLAIAGDEVADAKLRLEQVLRRANKLRSGGFDMEPLSVLAEMIRDPTLPTIGGMPQVLKVYQSAASIPFVVPWVDPEGVEFRSLLGRPLLDYERPRYPELPRKAVGL